MYAMSDLRHIPTRRAVFAGLALVLMVGLATLEYAHFRHHWLEAVAHAEHDADHRHDEHACTVLHEGVLVEATFEVPVLESPVERRLVPETLQRPVPPDQVAHAPRAPPHLL